MFFGSTSGCLGPFYVNFLGVLSHISEYRHMVRLHLHETTAYGKAILFVPAHGTEFTVRKRGEQWRVTR
jgi:hypothetical protein